MRFEVVTLPNVPAFGTPQQVALRSQMVLAAAEGQSDNGIAQTARGQSQDGHLGAHRPYPGGPGSSVGGGARAWSQTDLRSGEDPVHRQCHARYPTQGKDPMELPAHGGPARSQQIHHQ